MKKILQFLFEHKTLSREQAKEILTNISKGMYNETEVTAFVTVFLMRSITIEELQGFRDALLELCVKVDLNGHKAIDIVGTGGDGKNTFNISTLACFIVAGTGQKVAKHGNYGVSSVSGSSNVLEHFGFKYLHYFRRNQGRRRGCPTLGFGGWDFVQEWLVRSRQAKLPTKVVST